MLAEGVTRAGTYDLAGPEALSVREMAARPADVLGPPAWPPRSRAGVAPGPGASLPDGAREGPAGDVHRLRPGRFGWQPAWLWALLGRGPTTWAQAVRAALEAS